jgi:hypothetical protein
VRFMTKKRAVPRFATRGSSSGACRRCDIKTIGGGLLAIGLRSCSSTLTSNPLLDEEGTVDELNTLRFTLNQESNAASIQKVDILQVELWGVCALFNLCLQVGQIVLLNPAAQLKNGCVLSKSLSMRSIVGASPG